MKIKDLLLLLNMKAESKNIQYVLQYSYGYNSIKHKQTITSFMLKCVNGKMENREKVYGTEKILNYIMNEMKLYA